MLCWCFISLPPRHSPHDLVTRRAGRRAGWPRRAERALLEAVRVPDVSEMVLVPSPSNPRRVLAGSAYDPSHHFDRVPPMTDAEAFRYARDHVRAQRDLAVALRGDPRSAVQALGRALHAVQDACSHSNLVDLDGDARRRFVAAVLGDGPVPPEARLVSYLPGIRDPGLPDDPYPHDRFSKDSPGATNEARSPRGAGTKFDAAVEVATDASAIVLASFLAEADAGLHRELERLGGHDTLARTLRSVPLGVAAALAAGVAGWVLGRRRSG